MQKATFELNEELNTASNGDQYIELMKLLKIMQIAQTGGHAKILITEGEVSVNGEQELRKRKKLRAGDVVTLEGIEITIA